jgi:hypothetical protein
VVKAAACKVVLETYRSSIPTLFKNFGFKSYILKGILLFNILL